MINNNIDEIIYNLNYEYKYLIKRKRRLFNKKNKLINDMEFNMEKEYILYKKQVAINAKNNFNTSVENVILNKINKLYKTKNIIKRIFRKEADISIESIEFYPINLDVFKSKKYCFSIFVKYQVNNISNNLRPININKLEDIH